MIARRSWLRLLLWARRVRLARRATVVLAVAALLSGIATYAVMTGSARANPGADNALLPLLYLDLVLLLVLGALVARHLVKLWSARRRAGSRLRLRLVVLFSLVALIPTILVAGFAGLFFQAGMQAWFGQRVRTAVEQSQVVAQAYLKEHEQAITGQALMLANDLQRRWTLLAQSPTQLQHYLADQANLRGLTEAIVFDAHGKVMARAGFTLSLQFEQVPFWALAKAGKGEVALLTSSTGDRVRALIKLDVYPSMYLYVGRFIDATVLEHVRHANEAAVEYRRLEQGRSNLEVTFALIFIVVALLLLLAAVWLGMELADRLARPVVELIDASERVSGGDLSVRVAEIAAGDELAVLSRAFNRMTRRIANQQQSLLETNRQLDERRRFAETVLAGVSAGVLSVDPEGRLDLANRSAALLLGPGIENAQGRPLAEVVPEFAPVLNAAIARTEGGRGEGSFQEEVAMQRGDRVLTFLVRVTEERLEGEKVGSILTFDDITELQSAQRKAAWADVARRIAHEIRNPLTPIQLSAERLKRRYFKQITKDPEVFARCTDTIIRHVSEIGQMVDEFSSFARMPAPVMREENLGTLVSQAVFLQQTAYPAIRFSITPARGGFPVSCDAGQIGQCLTNLLKNAVEAIEGRDGDPALLPEGEIRVRIEERVDAEREMLAVGVEDNGRGLPSDRSRLTEPYVTTRPKGTGLGLAIVRKIMEDHAGDLILEDAPGGGARITLLLPRTETGMEVVAIPNQAAGPIDGA